MSTGTWSLGSSRFGQAQKDWDLAFETSCPGVGWVSGDGATHRVLKPKASLKSMLRAEGKTPERSGTNTGAPEAKGKMENSQASRGKSSDMGSSWGQSWRRTRKERFRVKCPEEPDRCQSGSPMKAVL